MSMPSQCSSHHLFHHSSLPLCPLPIFKTSCILCHFSPLIPAPSFPRQLSNSLFQLPAVYSRFSALIHVQLSYVSVGNILFLDFLSRFLPSNSCNCLLLHFPIYQLLSSLVLLAPSITKLSIVSFLHIRSPKYLISPTSFYSSHLVLFYNLARSLS